VKKIFSIIQLSPKINLNNLVFLSGMVETPRLQAKHVMGEMAESHDPINK
jgi:hypothetical protein